jgi:hypothetical protein
VAPSSIPSHNPTNTPTRSIKPSPSPSAAPTAPSPYPSLHPSAQPSLMTSAQPTLMPSPAANLVVSTNAPTATPINCYDSLLRLKIPKDGKMLTRYCSWVGAKDTVTRCSLDGVSAACPKTCGTCSSCTDPILRFRFTIDEKTISKSCEYIGRVQRKKGNRCFASGNICRSTCGVC